LKKIGREWILTSMPFAGNTIVLGKFFTLNDALNFLRIYKKEKNNKL
jgi:hypothetical protein